MKRAPHIGLLPMYISVYDDSLPWLRAEQVEFLQVVVAALRAEGLAVTPTHIACIRSEFEAAVSQIEASGADAIVTLHLAYSPSLESVDALAASTLPLLLLDTTPDHDFGPHTDPQRLLRNHGIHGVQDLAAMLRRRGRDYEVVAGHLSDPAVAARVADFARAAAAARALRTMRVLRVGDSFAGMGDFAVDDVVLETRLGVQVRGLAMPDLAAAVAAVIDSEIDREMASDLATFAVTAPAAVHRRSLRACLGLRECLEGGNYGAFSLNFLAFTDSEGPLSAVPFLECSKAMARGLGYAGEGDVLTAALVGALQAGFGDTTFTEMFCPDWAGGTIFLSHMGECNPALSADRPLLYEKEFPFTSAQNPAALGCAPRLGAATLVNIAPGPRDTFRLVTAPVEVVSGGTHPGIGEWVRAWIRPELPLAAFLEGYSRLGGTHHCALVMGEHTQALQTFGHLLGLEARAVGAQPGLELLPRPLPGGTVEA